MLYVFTTESSSLNLHHQINDILLLVKELRPFINNLCLSFNKKGYILKNLPVQFAVWNNKRTPVGYYLSTKHQPCKGLYFQTLVSVVTVLFCFKQEG